MPSILRSGPRETRERRQRTAAARRGGAFATRGKCVECGNPGGAVEQTPGVYKTLCSGCADTEVETLDVVADRLSWMRDAACAGDDRFTGRSGSADLAKVCAGCPVWRECAKYAWRVDGWSFTDGWAHAQSRETTIRSHDLYFVLAGLRPEERRNIESEDAMVEAAWAKLWALAMTA